MKGLGSALSARSLGRVEKRQQSQRGKLLRKVRRNPWCSGGRSYGVGVLNQGKEPSSSGEGTGYKQRETKGLAVAK